MKNIRLPSLSKILFIVFLTIYLAAAWYFSYFLNIYFNDTVSRTANAFFTVFGRNPHLASIGLVWLPLPSLLQIPLLVILHNFGLQMLSGPVVTSFLGALSVVLIYKISLLMGDGRQSRFSMLVTILYGLNPMVILYEAIGSSETIFILSLLLFSYFFLKWYLKSGILDLALAAFALVCAFGSRYEAIPLFIGGIFLVIAVGLSKKSSPAKIQATLILFGLPFTYAFVLWLLVNWLIMGDPLYFLNSIYSNSNYTNVFHLDSSLLENSYHSIFHSILYASKRILLLAPGLVLLPLVLFGFVKNKKEILNRGLLLAVLLIPYVSILIFHVYQLYDGKSFGWLRFFIYSIVALTLAALYFVNKHYVFRYLVIALLLMGFISTAYAMGNYNYGKEESSFVTKIGNNNIALDYSRTYSDQKAVAAFMNSQKGQILLDTSNGFAIPLFAINPKQYVITSDVDFLSVLKNYQSDVNWVIISDPESSKNNLINIYYPEMWSGKMSSVSLYKQIDSWRVYKVIKLLR